MGFSLTAAVAIFIIQTQFKIGSLSDFIKSPKRPYPEDKILSEALKGTRLDEVRQKYKYHELQRR